MQCWNLVRLAMHCLFVVGCATVATAAVRLPTLIGDNMVLQRGQPVPVWGWADKGEEVTVTAAGQCLTTKAGDDGRWKVLLAKLDLSEPIEMTIRSSSGSSIVLKNILVGEVWVGSGQSNMEWSVGNSNNAPQEIAAASYPKIRLFTVVKQSAAEPAAECGGSWGECSPVSVPGFSAVAYFFGRELNKELSVPVGLTLWALTKVYGKAIVYSSPIYNSMTTEGNKIRLQFDHVGSALMASDGKPLVDFTIAGADQKFVPTVATIDGNSIVVASDQVAQPVAVRYAWHDGTQLNLANREGLPASPFRTDTWKGVTEP